MRRNTEREMQFQEGLTDLFVEHEEAIGGFPQLVDVLLAWLIYNIRLRGLCSRETLLKIIGMTWDDIKMGDVKKEQS